MLNTLNINLKTDIKTDRPTTLPIKLMSQDKNNNQFILRFTNGGEPVTLDDTYTVEILTKFSNSGASRLTSATVRQDYATWEFDTAYITQGEMVYNYVYVRKSGSLVVSADANAFAFDVGLSEIDKDAGRVAEVYDENYQKYLDEFKDNVDFEEIAQAEQARKEAELLREENYEQKVDTAIVEADVVSKVDNKVTELTPQINDLTAQLAHKANQTDLDIEKSRIDSFTALDAGSTTGDAELIDGRIGADGKTYSNIGGAIRGQFGLLNTNHAKLSNDFDANVGGRTVISNAPIAESNKRLGASGEIINEVGYSYTDFLEINPSTEYSPNWPITGYTRIWEYDINNTQVKVTNSGNVLETSPTTRFIRYCGLTSEISLFKVKTPLVINTKLINPIIDNVLTGNVFDGASYADGYYGNTGTVVNIADFHNTAIPVSQGDVIRWKYEDADIANQNGVFFRDSSFKIAFKDMQKNVNNQYYEVTVPIGVDTAHINFKNPSTFVVVKNTPYRDDAKYSKISIPKLDIDDNVKRALSDADASLRNDVPYSKIFRKVACIGDSLTHGYYGDKDGTVYGTYKDYAYPSFLSKIIDAEVTNLGLSGRTTKTWYEQYSTAFPSDKTDWSKYDAFIIFLGTNGGLDGDINANAGNETQMGYYCRIIEMIQNANSETSIFLCTSPWTQSRDYFSSFTNQVIALGAAYSLPVLRLDQSQILTYENRLINQPYDRVLHFGRVGLMRMASEIVRCIDAYGSANPAYFNKLYGVKS